MDKSKGALHVSIENFIVSPISGAIIGYFTNWLAIKMLFRPHEEKRIFGIKVPFTPGLMPRERLRLSKRVGETVAEHIITEEMLREKMLSSESILSINTSLEHLLFEMKDELSQKLVIRFKDLLQDGELLKNMGKHITHEQMLFAERFAVEGLDKIVVFVEQMPQENPELDERLCLLVGQIIDDGVGKLASMFVNKEKIYESVKRGFCTYVSDENNKAEMIEKIKIELDKNSESKLYDLALKIFSEDQFSNLVENSISKLVSALIEMTTKEFLNESVMRHVLSNVFTQVLKTLEVGKMAEEQINTLQVAEVENIVISVVKKELQAITVVGGVLGFLIGLLTALINM